MHPFEEFVAHILGPGLPTLRHALFGRSIVDACSMLGDIIMTVEVIAILCHHALLVAFCEEVLDGVLPRDCPVHRGHLLTTIVVSMTVDLEVVEHGVGQVANDFFNRVGGLFPLLPFFVKWISHASWIGILARFELRTTV